MLNEQDTAAYSSYPSYPSYSEEQDGFVIDNDDKAEWTLKKIAEIEREYARLYDVCESQIAFYRERQEEIKNKRDSKRGGLVGMLAMYFESVPAKATKTQAKYPLISGTLIKKFAKPEFKHDPEKLTETLKDTDYVEMKPSLKWGEYKKTLTIVDDKAVDGNGEVVDGVTIEVKPASFDVEVLQRVQSNE